MTCQNCQHAEARRYTYRLHLLTRMAVLCDACLQLLTAMGLEFSPERTEPLRTPAWRANAKAKDLTGVR